MLVSMSGIILVEHMLLSHSEYVNSVIIHDMVIRNKMR